MHGRVQVATLVQRLRVLGSGQGMELQSRGQHGLATQLGNAFDFLCLMLGKRDAVQPRKCQDKKHEQIHCFGGPLG
jgi:hypothetical protein